ncbi:class I SAM-dependent methyltransferase [Asticcacaulis tiandongensis]|uniref:class I SAM-dependent methyltransferase n=1 Tax=Asticcacaulis tiandongensis TaxID=2565365 RepID=UPI00112A5FD7|nr:methyltransferase [Asticcacaulis tiandongensis]
MSDFFTDDPVSATLFLPFEQGQIDWPETQPALFLRARPSPALSEIETTRLVCDQSFKPDVDALLKAGYALRAPEDKALYPVTFVLPPRQRDEARALLARAVAATEKGGLIITAAANTEGAKTLEGDLKQLCGPVHSLSKHKCRVMWAVVGEQTDQALQADWAGLDRLRPVVDGRFVSRPGLFAWDRLDAGSQLLMKHLPELKGVGADLGAGFGYLTHEALGRYPEITRIDVYEAERRAIEASDLNLKAFGERSQSHWADVSKGLNATYDFIISNPPFHTSRADNHALGQSFIRTAASHLKIGGSLYMVANRHLPYEATLKAAFKTVTLLADDGAYKVYRGIK